VRAACVLVLTANRSSADAPLRRMAIVIPMVINGLWAVINFTCVPNTPKDIGIETEESREQEAIALAAGKDKDAEPSAIGIAQAFMLPNVMGYAIAFGFFKLINYAMFFQVIYQGMCLLVIRLFFRGRSYPCSFAGYQPYHFRRLSSFCMGPLSIV
jgi:hypothetical protein